MAWAPMEPLATGLTEEGRESPVIHGGDEWSALLDRHLF
jgi:hypothetical protein